MTCAPDESSKERGARPLNITVKVCIMCLRTVKMMHRGGGWKTAGGRGQQGYMASASDKLSIHHSLPCNHFPTPLVIPDPGGNGPKKHNSSSINVVITFPHSSCHTCPTQVDLPPWSNTRQNYESPRPGEFSRADGVVEVQIKLTPTVELCNSLPYALQVGREGMG